MSETLNKYVTVLYSADKTLLVLSGASSGVSFCSFSNVIGMPVRMASASLVVL